MNLMCFRKRVCWGWGWGRNPRFLLIHVFQNVFYRRKIMKIIYVTKLTQPTQRLFKRRGYLRAPRAYQQQ